MGSSKQSQRRPVDYRVPERDFQRRDYFLVEGADAAQSAAEVRSLFPHWRYEHQARSSAKYHVFSVPKGTLVKRDELPLDKVRGVEPLERQHRLYHRAPIPREFSLEKEEEESKRATDSSELPVEEARKKFEIDDPEFARQWHIVNTQFPGHDVDVLPLWAQNITGHGVVTAIIDDGLDYENPDLADAFCRDGSWDFNDNTALPKPRLSDDYHGTRCAGEIAARRGNGFCGVGVAYDSQVSGVRILSGDLTTEDEAAAMVYRMDLNDIYSCSWGPPDDGKSMDVPSKIVREAILRGTQEGRDGKGALYVFASGNGALHGDSCNFDGYTNSIYSITVTAIDHRGLHPPYAESCAAVMVSAYSSGSGEHIHTTDFHEGCSAQHGGTSAAAPLAAGLYALVLEANPALTWRDVQYLTVLSAAEIDPDGPYWQKTAIPGRKYSYRYGWGKLDAAKMADMAQNNYTLLKPQAWYYAVYTKGTDTASTPLDKRDFEDSPPGTTYASSYHVGADVIKTANLDHVEHVTVTVDIDSTKRGAVYVRLVSPHGLVSRLAQTRAHDKDPNGFQGWTFSSVAHWGEDPVGNWTLEVTNTDPDREKVRFKGWQLRLFGESIDASKAVKFNLDQDYSRHQPASKLPVPTTSSSVGSSATETPTSSSELPVAGSDLPDDSTLPDKSPHHPLLGPHAELYFLSLLVFGFVVCVILWRRRRKIGRALRRDEYEFDIINPEEEDSDFDRNSRIQQSDDDDVTPVPGRDSDEFYSAFERENLERDRLFQTSADTASNDLFRIEDEADNLSLGSRSTSEEQGEPTESSDDAQGRDVDPPQDPPRDML